jgi:hypothetical protein
LQNFSSDKENESGVAPLSPADPASPDVVTANVQSPTCSQGPAATSTPKQKSPAPLAELGNNSPRLETLIQMLPPMEGPNGLGSLWDEAFTGIDPAEFNTSLQ